MKLLIVPIDNFDEYESDDALAKAWYRPPHGNHLRQFREAKIKAGGKFSLGMEYRTEPGEGTHYAAICRVHFKWDLTGCNAIRFWLRPDGSGHAFMAQLNIADARGRNIHDLWEYRFEPERGDTSPRLVTIPFTDFVHNVRYADSPADVRPTIVPADLMEVAFIIGGRQGPFGEGIYYVDDLCGVATT